jgi:hypothetical protein
LSAPAASSKHPFYRQGSREETGLFVDRFVNMPNRVWLEELLSEVDKTPTTGTAISFQMFQNSTMSADSLDTRSVRKEAYTMLRTGQAIDKTLKWTMRTKLKTGSLAKVSLSIEPPASPKNISHVNESAPASPTSGGRRTPLHTPSLERTASFTQSGLAKSQPVAQSIDAPSALLTLKGNTVPVDFVKDAMVDIFRKENQALRESSPKGGVAMNFAVNVFIWI